MLCVVTSGPGNSSPSSSSRRLALLSPRLWGWRNAKLNLDWRRGSGDGLGAGPWPWPWRWPRRKPQCYRRLEQHTRTTRGWVCCRRANDLSNAARATLTTFQGPKNLRRCWRDGRRVTQSRSGARPNHGNSVFAASLMLQMLAGVASSTTVRDV